MATKTLCTGGGHSADYTSAASYEAYLTSLGTWGANETLQIKWASSADEVSWGNSNGNWARGGFTWKIMAFPGHSFRDHASKATNPLTYDNTKGACWKFNGAYYQFDIYTSTDGPIVIEDMQMEHTSAGSYTQVYPRSCGLTIKNCIMKSDSTAYSVYISSSATRTHTISNVLLLASGGSGIYLERGGGTVTADITRTTIVNLGSAGSTFGINNGFGAVGGTLYNVALDGFNTDVSWTPTSGSHNATSKSSGTSGIPATGAKYDLVRATEFESATVDFRVKGSTSVKLLNFGTAQGESTDIVGQADSGTRDIGAWEYQAAATFKLLTRVQAHGAFI